MSAVTYKWLVWMAIILGTIVWMFILSGCAGREVRPIDQYREAYGFPVIR